MADPITLSGTFDPVTALAESLGINIALMTTLIVIIVLWSTVWKAIAMWKSARNNHLVWFLVFVVFNTMGLLEIIYIVFFSKPKAKAEEIKQKKK